MIWMLLPMPNPYYCRNQECWRSTWPDLVLFSHTLCSYSFWCRFVTGSGFQNMVCRPTERFVCGEEHSSLLLRGPTKGHFTLAVPALPQRNCRGLQCGRAWKLQHRRLGWLVPTVVGKWWERLLLKQRVAWLPDASTMVFYFFQASKSHQVSENILISLFFPLLSNYEEPKVWKVFQTN